ncbi:cell wall assembly/cell proliferation coordinating protein, KNR4-like protein [Kribbella sp. ALI-6-A]|uniref:SMI1/KNR4 family protein n=1 Tax=Kribbella sp. ALI-6-A TaxID=1933817 RepID=UPI00097BB013|nr:SMI1/KNR4 family protein [Kribbella sp. ALI-6-A]ONI71846.1 cell wall assembly/cell proliferation coordinating protein, KNR4-like protein [Kribbella sp. ALI-6-A]
MPRLPSPFTDAPAFEPPPTDALIASIEAELGLRLPPAYIALSRLHNGGHVARNAHPAPTPTTWAEDHVGITSIAAIGRTAPFSLCGPAGNTFWITVWGYPDIGLYFADCPSAGHDLIALDYRHGDEPSVVHVDQERDYQITPLAADFPSFIAGLIDDDTFDLD